MLTVFKVMDSWTLNPRYSVRPRFDSLRDHADINAFLEQRRRRTSVVHELNPNLKSKIERRMERVIDPGEEHAVTPDTGFGSRRESSASQRHANQVEVNNILNRRRSSTNLEIIRHERRPSGTPPPDYPQTGNVIPFTAGDRRPSIQRHKKKNRHKIWRMCWLVFCLIGTFVHFFLTTLSFMKYETATETVIGMPLAVKIPATAVCFPIWSMIRREMLKNGSLCFNVTSIKEVEDCELELFGQHQTVWFILQELTKNPIDLIDEFEIRKPAQKLEWIRDNDLIDLQSLRRYRRNQSNVLSYYKGPDKCVSFHAVPLDPIKEPEQLLSMDRMTTAKSRIMFSGSFKVSRDLTPDIHVIRLYVHESGTYPRGTVTLPIVANLTKNLAFTVSYTKIETTYLPAPYFSRCVDYNLIGSRSFGGQKLESKEHCVARCVRDSTKADPMNPSIPADHLLMRDISTLTHFEMREIRFMPSNHESISDVERECMDKCQLDCLTKNFYTSLSQSDLRQDDSVDQLQVKTMFQNPETSVKFIPKLDFEAYVIYIAGVFSIWFSASVYHMCKDSFIFTYDILVSNGHKWADERERNRKLAQKRLSLLPNNDHENNNIVFRRESSDIR